MITKRKLTKFFSQCWALQHEIVLRVVTLRVIIGNIRQLSIKFFQNQKRTVGVLTLLQIDI